MTVLTHGKTRAFLRAAVLASSVLLTALLTGCKEDSALYMFPAHDMSVAPLSEEADDTPEPAPQAEFEPEMLGIVPGTNTTELRFTWYAAGTDANRTTRIRLYNAAGTAVIKDTAGTNATAGSNSGKRYHKAVLTGLEPGTAYKYSVSHNGTDWSYKYDIKIPAPGAFRFAAVSDPQIDLADKGGVHKSEWIENVNSLTARDVSFIVSGGDQINAHGGDENEYAAFFSPPQLRNIPFAPAMGNHDMHMHFIYHFNLPNASTSISSYRHYPNYWYLYNNILFVVLNTGLYFEYMGGQTTPSIEAVRFDSVLTAATRANAGKYDWLIVQHHRSTRSIGPHSEPDAEDQNTINYRLAGIEGIIEKHGADLVISGHDHLYVRTRPIKDGKVVTSGHGTVYLTLSAATEYKQYPPNTRLGGDWVALATKIQMSGGSWRWNPGYGHAIFDVNGGTISVKVYSMVGGSAVEDDSFTLTKAATSVLERERVVPAQR